MAYIIQVTGVVAMATSRDTASEAVSSARGTIAAMPNAQVTIQAPNGRVYQPGQFDDLLRGESNA